MTELYTPERKRALLRRVRAAEGLAALALAAAILTAVGLCFGVRTGNALNRLRLCVGICSLAGAGALAAAEFVSLPGRRLLRHMERIEQAPREERAGKVERVGEAVRIPRSITFAGVTVAEEGGCGRYKLALGLSGPPAEGQEIRFAVRNGYMAALEAPGPLKKPAVRGRLRRVLGVATRCVLCLIGFLVLWGFVFSHLTEAPAREKVTLFIHAVRVDTEKLSGVLEEDLPEGIRLVQARPFTYAMMDPETLMNADLYILSAKDAPAYMDWLAPLPEDWSGGGDRLSLEGGAAGIRADGAGRTFVTYLSPESGGGAFYLFFGKNSLHGPNGDGKALPIAQRFLSLAP